MSGEGVDRVLRRYQLEASYPLYVGTLELRKNLVRLVRAFGLVRRKDPGNIPWSWLEAKAGNMRRY